VFRHALGQSSEPPYIVATAREALSIIGLTVLAVALIVTVVWQYRLRTGPRGADPVVVATCVAAYQRAHSLADSAIVDAQRQVVSREQAPNARTCGQLRRDGTLARPRVR
jgi:hypothetical protein